MPTSRRPLLVERTRSRFLPARHSPSPKSSLAPGQKLVPRNASHASSLVGAAQDGTEEQLPCGFLRRSRAEVSWEGWRVVTRHLEHRLPRQGEKLGRDQKPRVSHPGSLSSEPGFKWM